MFFLNKQTASVGTSEFNIKKKKYRELKNRSDNLWLCLKIVL